MVILLEDEFKIPIYKFRVHLAITDNVEEYLGDVGIDEDNRCGGIVYDLTNLSGAKAHFLLVFDKDCLNGGTIVHESLHIVDAVMRKIGCPLTEDTEEPRAYLQEYLYNVIGNKINKYKDGNTNTPTAT